MTEQAPNITGYMVMVYAQILVSRPKIFSSTKSTDPSLPQKKIVVFL
jgi:hypothetical protein